MKISLLYNVDAGDGVSAHGLKKMLEAVGHDVVQVIEKDSDFERVLDGSAELLVAAGGDGTVCRALRSLAGRKMPMAILPLGTANNVARSIGIEGTLEQIARSWTGASPRPLDVGIVRGAWGEDRFVESVGGGLISSGIEAMNRGEPPVEESGDSPADRVTDAVRGYRHVLSRLQTRHLKLTVDGTDLEGDYLLVEVLNMRSVGPNFVVSPDADPSDGFFHVVTASKEHRPELERYLQDRIDQRDAVLALPTRKARQVEIEGWQEMHVDDEVRTGSSIGTVSVEIDAAARRLLA